MALLASGRGVRLAVLAGSLLMGGLVGVALAGRGARDRAAAAS